MRRLNRRARRTWQSWWWEIIPGAMPVGRNVRWLAKVKKRWTRKSITLEQEELIKQVFAHNSRTVVVLRASFPYAINWTQEHVPAIVHTTNSSQEEGNALADVLFSDYNPGAKLVDTWPKSLDQLLPMMDSDLRHGRTYMYFKGQSLYPFGFGLSYTTFKYANAKVSTSQLPANGQIVVSFGITNSGTRPGDEVVQLSVKHSDTKWRGSTKN
jgi:beta-glucosidase